MKSGIVGVQLLRALAAILVVIWHDGNMAGRFAQIDLAIPRFFQFGYAGVDIFFVISGFIICYIALSKPFHWRDFARRRFLRVYPFYAFFTLLALLVWAVHLGWTIDVPTPTPLSVVKALLIWPQGLPILTVGWSLEYEVQFYILAGLIFSLGFSRALSIVLLLLFVAELAFRYAFREPASYWYWFMLSHQLEFALGTIIYFNRNRIAALGWLMPLVGATLLFAICAWDLATMSAQQPLWQLSFEGMRLEIGYSIGSALFLIAALNADFSGWRGLPGRIVATGIHLGDASYALYLSHLFVLAVVVRAGMYLGAHDFGVYVVLLAAIVAACCFASLFHIWIERPLLAFFEARNRPDGIVQAQPSGG